MRGLAMIVATSYASNIGSASEVTYDIKEYENLKGTDTALLLMIDESHGFRLSFVETFTTLYDDSHAKFWTAMKNERKKHRNRVRNVAYRLRLKKRKILQKGAKPTDQANQQHEFNTNILQQSDPHEDGDGWSDLENLLYGHDQQSDPHEDGDGWSDLENLLYGHDQQSDPHEDGDDPINLTFLPVDDDRQHRIQDISGSSTIAEQFADRHAKHIDGSHTSPRILQMQSLQSHPSSYTRSAKLSRNNVANSSLHKRKRVQGSNSGEGAPESHVAYELNTQERRERNPVHDMPRLPVSSNSYVDLPQLDVVQPLQNASAVSQRSSGNKSNTKSEKIKISSLTLGSVEVRDLVVTHDKNSTIKLYRDGLNTVTAIGDLGLGAPDRNCHRGIPSSLYTLIGSSSNTIEKTDLICMSLTSQHHDGKEKMFIQKITVNNFPRKIDHGKVLADLKGVYAILFMAALKVLADSMEASHSTILTISFTTSWLMLPEEIYEQIVSLIFAGTTPSSNEHGIEIDCEKSLPKLQIQFNLNYINVPLRIYQKATLKDKNSAERVCRLRIGKAGDNIAVLGIPFMKWSNSAICYRKNNAACLARDI